MLTILMIRAVRGPDGGLERHFLRIANGLLETGRVKLVFVLSAKRGIMYEFALARKIPCYAIAVHDYRNLVLNVFQFLSICKKHDVRVVQSHMLPESIFGRFARLLRPSIRHIFRVHTHIDNVPISEARKRIYHWLDRWSSFLVDFYVPLSEWLVEELATRSHVPRRKILIATNGTDAPGAPDVLDAGSQVLRPVLAVVGRICHDKGQHLVLQALSLLRGHGHNVGVEFFGAGETSGRLEREQENAYVEWLRALVREERLERQVTFHGHVDDVPKAIRGIPVLVLPSYHEGISNAILEALSLRKVVVASAVGGTTDVIRHGENGFLFPGGDATALAEILGRVFSVPGSTYNDLRNRGYLTWQERFSTSKMLDELLFVYRKLGLDLT